MMMTMKTYTVTINFISGPSFTCEVETFGEKLAREIARGCCRENGFEGKIVSFKISAK